jgi:probable phosphoglycerate mutase
MLTRKPFYFLRHGQTDWNVAKRIQGQTDIPLNEHGRQQAFMARNIIGQLNIGGVFTSQLSRAFDTAAIVKPDAIAVLNVVDELKEVTIGERDGHQSGLWYQQWKAGEAIIPGAETRAEFRVRVIEGLNKVLQQVETPLIVSHGGVYGALTESIEISPEVSITNCMLLYITPGIDEQWLVDVVFSTD